MKIIMNKVRERNCSVTHFCISIFFYIYVYIAQFSKDINFPILAETSMIIFVIIPKIHYRKVNTMTLKTLFLSYLRSLNHLIALCLYILLVFILFQFNLKTNCPLLKFN